MRTPAFHAGRTRGPAPPSHERTSRTYAQIVGANVLTRFNAILGSLLVVILVVGPFQDALFGIVLGANALIGIVQEVRAKHTLDRLAVLHAPRARVVRDGWTSAVSVDAVVPGDVLEVRTGDQIPCDGYVSTSGSLDVDESLLTGEREPVHKAPGDEVLSGSFVVSGTGTFRATRVGADTYARRLTAEARQFQPARSELMDGIDFVLRLVTYALGPVAALLLWSQLESGAVETALRGTVAGIVAMVPLGLVLLTSVAFAVAALRLARRRVLVQELSAIEALARVDVVCLDKTGTLTEGEIVFDDLESLDGTDSSDALGALAVERDASATLAALGAQFAPPGWTCTGSTPFSSSRKWSAASFAGHGTWVLGAPEIVLAATDHSALERTAALAADGRRVLALTSSDAALADETLPRGLVPRALVLFAEQVRADAADTVRYFHSQGIALKVISGDNVRTVAAIAQRVGIAGSALDARRLPDDAEAFAENVEAHTVFGRVTPQQKRAMIAALQSRGHVVAMTGDGVNDTLALKDADIGVAMGSGATATRGVAQLVLLDDSFATMPRIVAEGRRVMANIERSANLFVTKTIWATLIATVVGGLRWEYPFLPRQITFIDVLTIGLPGFALALRPNARRYVPGFIGRVLRFTTPAGIGAGTAALIAFAIAHNSHDVSIPESRTTAVGVIIAVSVSILSMLVRPFSRFNIALVAAVLAGVATVFAVPWLRWFYDLELPPAGVVADGAIVTVVAVIGVVTATSRFSGGSVRHLFVNGALAPEREASGGTRRR